MKSSPVPRWKLVYDVQKDFSNNFNRVHMACVGFEFMRVCVLLLVYRVYKDVEVSKTQEQQEETQFEYLVKLEKMVDTFDLSKLNDLFTDVTECEEKNTATRVDPSSLVPKQRIGKRDEKREEKDDDAIWDPEHVETPHQAALKSQDERPQPDYDIVFKQRVGSEDMYLGTNDMDPSSNCCSDIVLKVKLPKQKFSDLDLDVQKQSIVVTSPEYRLATYLPYPVDHENGTAKWFTETETLAITLRILDE